MSEELIRDILVASIPVLGGAFIVYGKLVRIDTEVKNLKEALKSHQANCANFKSKIPVH